jgi:hypothetical protein
MAEVQRHGFETNAQSWGFLQGACVPDKNRKRSAHEREDQVFHRLFVGAIVQ